MDLATVYTVAGIAAGALLVYLVWALLRAEDF